MQSGRSNKLTGQIGEYLVCAELGRRGLIATPFSGNVPAFDVLATDEFCRTVPIQVKASNSTSWFATATDWMNITIEKDGIQKFHGLKTLVNADLIYVCIAISKPSSAAKDRYFILTKSDVQQAIYKGYSAFMAKHDWKRPRQPASFSANYFIPSIEQFENNWDLITDRFQKFHPHAVVEDFNQPSK